MWPAPHSSAEKEFKRVIEHRGFEESLHAFERDAHDALTVVVARPDLVTYEWLSRIHMDTYPETSRLSRDIHVAAHPDGVRVWFYPARQEVLAQRSVDRKRKRAAQPMSLVPPPHLEGVPKPLEEQAIHAARRMWDAFPAASDTRPEVRYFAASKQLEVLLVCPTPSESGESPRITFDDLHQFVSIVQAKRVWVECHADGKTLAVGARVPADALKVTEEPREMPPSKRQRSS